MSISLKQIETNPPKDISKKEIQNSVRKLKKKLISLQAQLYAENSQSLLVILQGMDTSGKDSAIKHVFSGVNPQGCRVKSFTVPSEEENAHHFLWRVSKECPEKRFIQIFNRSHYEHILENVIVGKMSGFELKINCDIINSFEKGLEENGTKILKFYLHVSQRVQFERLEIRKTDPKKHWKYQQEDKKSIEKHDHYVKIYESIFKNSQLVPWHIVPSDQKWFKNYLILKQIVEQLEKLLQSKQ